MGERSEGDERAERVEGAAAGGAANPVVPGPAAGADGQAAGAAEEPAAVALVNGEPMPTALLTRYIDGVRSRIGSQTDAAWEAYLADQGCTPDTYWARLIEHYGREMAVTQRCRALGIAPGPAEVDARLADVRRTVEQAGGAAADVLWDSYVARHGGLRGLRAELAYALAREELFARELGAFAAGEGAGRGRPGGGAGADGSGSGELPAQGTPAWRELCGRYVAALYAASEVRVLVPHQYDVPGQRHGGPPRAAPAGPAAR